MHSRATRTVWRKLPAGLALFIQLPFLLPSFLILHRYFGRNVLYQCIACTARSTRIYCACQVAAGVLKDLWEFSQQPTSGVEAGDAATVFITCRCTLF